MSYDPTDKLLSSPSSVYVHLPYMMQLFDTLMPYLNYRVYPVGKRLNFSAGHQSECYFFRKGAYSLHRQPDDILLEIFEAPSLRGCIPVQESSPSLFTLRVIESSEPAEVAIIDKEKFYTLLTKHNLWEIYARHLQMVASISIEVLFKLSSPSVFEQVRTQLYELMSKPLILRESITAENYIRSKTRLSRSAIMNTLSALKKGGYISIENGHLMDIRFIPSRF